MNPTTEIINVDKKKRLLASRGQLRSYKTLLRILSYQRPAKTKGEQDFVSELIEVLEKYGKPELDGFDNIHFTIPHKDGSPSSTMFSCHTDMVCPQPNKDFRQSIQLKGGVIYPAGKHQLGADDGTGLWLMLCLIEAKTPGLYIFHREEEIGGRGSSYIAQSEPERLAGIQRAIAFDRRGTTDVITYQASGKCASNEFALALSTGLGMGYKPCENGVFTDTANYTHLIPECTNVSCGYDGEHSYHETQDLRHAARLRDAILKLNWDELPTVRDVADHGYDDPWADYYRPRSSLGPDRELDLIDAVEAYPEAAASLLELYGLCAKDILDEERNLELQWSKTH